jgi:hypothetical protein
LDSFSEQRFLNEKTGQRLGKKPKKTLGDWDSVVTKSRCFAHSVPCEFTLASLEAKPVMDTVLQVTGCEPNSPGSDGSNSRGRWQSFSGLLMPLSPKGFTDSMDQLFNDSGHGMRRFQNQE